VEQPSSRPRGRFERFVRRLWWLHSFWALAFGVGVIVYARKGLAHPDKLLLAVAISWLLVFIALRFIVGVDNVSPEDRFYKKGLRVATNYVIKNLYQQMFFFLVPFYFASTTWSLESRNWWLAPLLLVCAVLSTMDLVMDNFIMQRRAVAAILYGICLFAVLNLVLPIALQLSHSDALMVAMVSTAPAVALLTFPLRSVCSPVGLMLTIGATLALGGAGWYGHRWIPPAPLAMRRGAVSHGTEGSREIVGEHHDRIAAGQLSGLRCTTWLDQPGGVHDELEHVWIHGGREWRRTQPSARPAPVSGGVVLRSRLVSLPADPTGEWTCAVETGGGQLIGRLEFVVVPDPPPPIGEAVAQMTARSF